MTEIAALPTTGSGLTSMGQAVAPSAGAAQAVQFAALLTESVGATSPFETDPAVADHDDQRQDDGKFLPDALPDCSAELSGIVPIVAGQPLVTAEERPARVTIPQGTQPGIFSPPVALQLLPGSPIVAPGTGIRAREVAPGTPLLKISAPALPRDAQPEAGDSVPAQSQPAPGTRAGNIAGPAPAALLLTLPQVPVANDPGSDPVSAAAEATPLRLALQDLALAKDAGGDPILAEVEVETADGAPPAPVAPRTVPALPTATTRALATRKPASVASDLKPAAAGQPVDPASPKVEAMVSVPSAEPLAPAAPFSSPALHPQSAPAVTPSAQVEPRQDFAALIDRLIDSRNAVSPAPVHTALTHTEFGEITFRFSHGDAGLSVSMASADPGFAPAVQAALPAERSAPHSDDRAAGHGGGAQLPTQTTTDQRGANQTAPQPRGPSDLPKPMRHGAPEASDQPTPRKRSGVFA
jgi:Meckel syndrome type 1 protein